MSRTALLITLVPLVAALLAYHAPVPVQNGIRHLFVFLASFAPGGTTTNRGEGFGRRGTAFVAWLLVLFVMLMTMT